jgi:hypothetical protein
LSIVVQRLSDSTSRVYVRRTMVNPMRICGCNEKSIVSRVLKMLCRSVTQGWYGTTAVFSCLTRCLKQCTKSWWGSGCCCSTTALNRDRQLPSCMHDIFCHVGVHIQRFLHVSEEDRAAFGVTHSPYQGDRSPLRLPTLPQI